MIERERRFLVRSIPDVLPTPHYIAQGYLSTRPASIRVRRQDGLHTLTIKTGSGLARTEIERRLDPDEFEALWGITNELQIDKRRYRIDLYGGHVAELDLFDGDLTGRRIVEVEFDSDEAAGAFDPPEWFGREVTDDGRYSNASLAAGGWPDEE